MLFVAALIVTAEVIIRKALPDGADLIASLLSLVGWNVSAMAGSVKDWLRGHLTFSGSDEISGYLFAVGTSWSLAYVLVTRGHVRIDVLYGTFSPRVRALLDLVALVALAVFVGALLERAWDVAATNLFEFNRSNTNLRIPLAWPQLPWLGGIALFLLAIVTAFVRAVGLLRAGDYAGVNSVVGATSQDEEIESELKGLGLETTTAPKA